MKKNIKRQFQGMSYRQLQQWNKSNISKQLDKQRKQLQLKNIGWDQVIELYKWIKSELRDGLSDAGKAVLAQLDGFIEARDDIHQAISSLDQILSADSKKGNVIAFPTVRIVK